MSDPLSADLSSWANLKFGPGLASWRETQNPQMRKRARTLIETEIEFRVREIADKQPELAGLTVSSVEWTDNNQITVSVTLPGGEVFKGSFDPLVRWNRKSAPWNF